MRISRGKLAALMARHASRDLFDAHRLLMQTELDQEKLRLGFVLFGAMNRKDWRTIVTATEDNAVVNGQLLRNRSSSVEPTVPGDRVS